MLKLADVSEHIYFKFRKSQIEAMKTERLGIIHVSDIIKPCMRNVIYNKIQPNSGMSTEDYKSLYFGQLLHSNSMMALPEHHEKFLAYNYVKDEPVTREEALQIPPEDPEHLDIIYGSIDDLIEVEGRWVICDKKTTGSIEYFQRATAKPSESHIDQINRYRVLLKKCYDIDAEFGCVVYISNRIEKDKRDKPITISFKLKPVEETLKDMIEKSREIKKSMTECFLPKRTKNYLCDGMCPYASICFNDDREKWKE
jgi:CRISPR/Cas system-associated exonuclease Cas4 (RecB family)